MINYTLGTKEFEFDPRLRATEKLKKAFNKDYTKLLETIDTLTIQELIKFIYNVIKNPDMTLTEFTEWCYDELGKGDIDDCVGWLIQQLQFPGITEEDFIKKIQERKAQEKLISNQD